MSDKRTPWYRDILSRETVIKFAVQGVAGLVAGGAGSLVYQRSLGFLVYLFALVASHSLILKSVFRSAARRTGLPESAPQSGAAPVSEKRIGLNRSPRRGYGY